jgi:tetratricopeptide (TPR) repeat protein
MVLEAQIQRRILASSGFADLGLYQEAVDELEEIPEQAKDSVPVLVAWLEVYQNWQKWGEAVAVADRLIEKDPEDPSWFVALAYATRRARDLSSAREILQGAAAKFPGCAVIHFNLGCYAAQLGELEQARRYLAAAIDLDQSFAELAKSDPDLEPLRSAL